MIKTDRQMTTSQRKLEGLKARIEHLADRHPDPRDFDFYAEVTRGHVAQLEWELECYGLARAGRIDELLEIWNRHGALKPGPHAKVTLGEFLGLVRVARGLTQAALADQLGTAQANIARLERSDHTSFTLDTLDRVFAALGIRLTLHEQPAQDIA